MIGPGALKPAGDRIGALAAAKAVLPAKTLLLDGSSLGLGTDVLARWSSAVGFAERVAANNERNGLFVIHRHAAERFANVLRCEARVRVAAWPLRVHVDQAHVVSGEWSHELSVLGMALVAQPGILCAPEDLLRLPDILSPEAEAERLEPHRFQGHVAGEDEQIGPGDLPPVLLLDRPEQPARLVQVRVVGPAVERSEALRPAPAPAPTIGDAVGARGMPRHPDEEWPIVAEVGWPPILGRGHQLDEVALERFHVEGLELFCVVEVLVHPGPSPLRRRRGDGRILTLTGARCRWLALNQVRLRHVAPPLSVFPSA